MELKAHQSLDHYIDSAVNAVEGSGRWKEIDTEYFNEVRIMITLQVPRLLRKPIDYYKQIPEDVKIPTPTMSSFNFGSLFLEFCEVLVKAIFYCPELPKKR